jgi:hypothetical protein
MCDATLQFLAPETVQIPSARSQRRQQAGAAARSPIDESRPASPGPRCWVSRWPEEGGGSRASRSDRWVQRSSKSWLASIDHPSLGSSKCSIAASLGGSRGSPGRHLVFSPGGVSKRGPGPRSRRCSGRGRRNGDRTGAVPNSRRTAGSDSGRGGCSIGSGPGVHTGPRMVGMRCSLPGHWIVWSAQGSGSTTGNGGRARSRVDGVGHGRRYVAQDRAGSRCTLWGTGSGEGGTDMRP